MAKSRTIHVYYILGRSLLLFLILSLMGIIKTRTRETISEESLLPATDTWWGPTIAIPPISPPPIPNPVPAPPPMPPILSVSTYT